MIRLLTYPLYQWDTGRQVSVIPEKGITVDEVHCYNGTMDSAYKLEIEKDEDIAVCTIPDVFLTTTNDLVFYSVMEDGTGKRTTEKAMFKVTPRPKPSDYVYEDDEIKTWELIKDRVEKIEDDLDKLESQTGGSANFVAQDSEPEDTSVLWVDTDDE